MSGWDDKRDAAVNAASSSSRALTESKKSSRSVTRNDELARGRSRWSTYA